MNERYHTPGQALDQKPLIRLPFRGKPRDINPCFPCAHSGMNKFTSLISLENKNRISIIIIILLFSFSCAASFFDKDTRIINLNEFTISSFDFKLNDDVITPGSSYHITVIVYDEKGKVIPGIVDFADLQIKTDCFELADQTLIAGENIFSLTDNLYELFIKIADLDYISKKYPADLSLNNSIPVNEEKAVFELGYYNLSNQWGSAYNQYIIIYNRTANIYYLRPDSAIFLKPSLENKQITVLYKMSDNLFARINTSAGADGWSGSITASPLQDLSLLFNLPDAPQFERNNLF